MNNEDLKPTGQRLREDIKKARTLVEEIFDKQNILLESWPPSLSTASCLISLCLKAHKDFFSAMLEKLEDEFETVVTGTKDGHEDKS